MNKKDKRILKLAFLLVAPFLAFVVVGKFFAEIAQDFGKIDWDEKDIEI